MGVETIIGLALAAAGTGMQMSAASSSRKAMNDQVKAQLATQEGFQRQATPIAKEAIADAGADSAKRRQAAGAEAAMQRYGQSKLGDVVSPLPVDSRSANAQVGQYQQASAGAQGYSDVALQNFLRNQRAGTNLGVISNLAGASAGTAPILTQLAGQKGATMGALGSLLSTAGSLAGVYGGLKSRAPAAAGGVTTLPASSQDVRGLV